MILVGATHTMTDSCMLAEYFLKNNIGTRVITIPATVDGNIHHKYISTSLGFDTSSKIFS